MYQALNASQRDLLIVLLLHCNHQEREWEWSGKTFKAVPGQFVTSLATLVGECAKDTSIQNVRTGLKKLEKWRFLTYESTKSGRLITICKWDVYQDSALKANKDTNKELTKSQQRANKELTTNNNVENVVKKGEKGKKSDSLSEFLKDGEFETITGREPYLLSKDPEICFRAKQIDYFKIWKDIRQPVFGVENWATPSERDYGFLKQIISMSGDNVEVFKAKAQEYLKSDQDFYRKVHWNLQTFVSNWAELGLKKKGKNNHIGPRKPQLMFCSACNAQKKEDCHCG